MQVSFTKMSETVKISRTNDIWNDKYTDVLIAEKDCDGFLKI